MATKRALPAGLALFLMGVGWGSDIHLPLAVGRQMRKQGVWTEWAAKAEPCVQLSQAGE